MSDDPKQFSVTMAYDVTSDDPKDAVQTMLAAIDVRGSVMVSVYQDGIADPVFEDEIHVIAPLPRKMLDKPVPSRTKHASQLGEIKYLTFLDDEEALIAADPMRWLEIEDTLTKAGSIEHCFTPRDGEFDPRIEWVLLNGDVDRKEDVEDAIDAYFDTINRGVLEVIEGYGSF